ncbi:hypothetical protein AAMO2058_000355200 [Amorphochlora amoebiformis]
MPTRRKASLATRAKRRRKARKTAYTDCLRPPSHGQWDRYNRKMRYHEREDVILSKTRKMVRDGVPDPALVLQYEKLAREARMPCGTFIEGGNRVRKPPTRLQEKENNLRLANMSRRFSNSKKMAHEVSKLRSSREDWKKED